MGGIPLAIQQAGALILDGEYSFAGFIKDYGSKYIQLMAENRPQEGVWSYEKDRIMTTILDIAYRTVESIPNHAALLNFIGVLGSWQIPISLLQQFRFFEDYDDDCPVAESDIELLKQVLHNPGLLRLTLHRLARLCLITLKEEGCRIKSFMIHRVMCQWCVERVKRTKKQSYFIYAAYGLAKDVFNPAST